MTESSSQTANPAEAAITDLIHRLTQQEQTLPLLMEQLIAANQRYQQLETLVRQIQDGLSQPHQPSPPAEPSSAAPATSVSPGPEASGTTEITHFSLVASPPAVTFSAWNEDAHLAAFTEALNDWVRNQLALCPEPCSLEEFIRLATSIDKRHLELRRQDPGPSLPPPREWVQLASGHSTADSSTTEEPIQMGRTRLSQEEREHWLRCQVRLVHHLNGAGPLQLRRISCWLIAGSARLWSILQVKVSDYRLRIFR
uniref:Uncharacterized protein n=2 Tax=Nothobranchius pienaari TaxID=704102 RepID=A0A1A8MDD3_9TELE